MVSAVQRYVSTSTWSYHEKKKLLKFIQKPFSSLDRNIHAELDDIKGLLRVALIKIAYLESSLVPGAESSPKAQ